MYAYKIETEIPKNHRLSIELPADCPEGAAEVIVLLKNTRPNECPDTDLKDFLNWLETQPASGRSKAEIDAEIAAERASWEN